MSNIYNIIPKYIKNLTGYQSARKIGGNGKIWLNANESPYLSKLSISFKKLNRYPHFQPEKLLLAYSLYSKIPKKNILITRGADEGIDLLIRVFCERNKDSIITIPPTYGMYDIIAKIAGIQNKKIFMLWEKNISINRIISNIKNVKIIFICRPNNPTGHLINKKTIYSILKLSKNKFFIVIDEAYIDFCITDNLSGWIKEFKNLIILRTLSKAFGLAGIRCGFILASSKIINIISKIIAPYPIPYPTYKIAYSFFSPKNINLLKKHIITINFNRFWLFHKLKKIKLIQEVFTSYANFILIKTLYVKKIFFVLQRNGIIVRDQHNVPMLRGCLRISIGTHSECKKIIETLKNLNS
ncbi:histidinol-phosphate transaminase [Buchnera aphidicola]|uniref:histidinol-phosphate transaminase n=1 Tax=Buchnera aphidicola TaxID=9 RepID=UPI0021C89AD5|nr:histidinol-phosphate transaminase [Buchnera aphidicola]